MNALRLHIATLMLLALSIAAPARAEVHRSDFESIPGKYPDYKPDYGWLHLTSPDGWDAYRARFISLGNFNLEPMPDDLNHTVLAIRGEGTIASPLLENGLKNLSFHYAHYNPFTFNNTKYQFTVELEFPGRDNERQTLLSVSQVYMASSDTYFSRELDISEPCRILITNTAPVTNYGEREAVGFWNFEWEDNGYIEPTLPPGDNYLDWSQPTGAYRNGTAIMVNGKPGSSLKLYDTDNNSLIGEVPGSNGVIPTIAYHLSDNSTCHLKAVSEADGQSTVSLHNFATSASGLMPAPALSLPDGLYDPATPAYATGIPGENLTITCSGSRSGTLDSFSIPSEAGLAPCRAIHLPGDNEEFLTITLTSDGCEPVTYHYYLKSADASVADTEADINDTCVYYDLFGHRLQQRPTNGLYIERNGRTARIVLIK
ncbi:MAG: hypothetical protein K2I56_10545 [Muribaculaceae bacterium]|nr:hypothetical protein [Muribaculaceae bacterium]